MKTSFIQLASKRQSVRKYKADKVVHEQLMLCVEAARIAPSACNAQPWHFILIEDETLKNAVADCAADMGMNNFCRQAPAIVVIVQEKPNMTSKVGSLLKGIKYTLIDIGIAAEHFCLQATELGLGTCIIGWFNEKKLRKLLSIPSSKRILLLITIGYADDTPREKIRKPLEKMYSENRYL